MIVVSDASPLNVLVRIGHADLLHELFGSVLVPPAVASELSHVNTPEVVRAWLSHRPPWLRVQAPTRMDSTLELDDPGEREAISLALEVNADLLLERWGKSPTCAVGQVSDLRGAAAWAGHYGCSRSSGARLREKPS